MGSTQSTWGLISRVSSRTYRFQMDHNKNFDGDATKAKNLFHDEIRQHGCALMKLAGDYISDVFASEMASTFGLRYLSDLGGLTIDEMDAICARAGFVENFGVKVKFRAFCQSYRHEYQAYVRRKANQNGATCSAQNCQCRCRYHTY